MVDDVFFIARKSAMRAISSHNVPCVCAVMSLMHSLLTKDYFAALQKSNNSGPSAFLHAILADQEVYPTLHATHRIESGCAGRRGSAVVQSVSEQSACLVNIRDKAQIRTGSAYCRYVSDLERKGNCIFTFGCVSRTRYAMRQV